MSPFRDRTLVLAVIILLAGCSSLTEAQNNKLDYTVSPILDNAKRPERSSLNIEDHVYRDRQAQENGWNYAYYEGNWDRVPAFENLEPAHTGTANRVDLSEVDAREDRFAVRFSGYLKLDEATDVRTALSSDDGSILWINEKKVVDNDGRHGTETAVGSLQLEAGVHRIVVGYFEASGGQTVSLGHTSKPPHVQTWVRAMDVAPDGAVYTTAGWDEAHHENAVYKDGFVLPHYKSGGGNAIAVDQDHVYVNRNDQLEKFNRHNYEPVNFDGTGSNTLDVHPDWGLEVFNDRLFVSTGSGKPVRVYDKHTGELVDTIGSFRKTVGHEEIPLHLAAGEQGLWCIRGTIRRNIVEKDRYITLRAHGQDIYQDTQEFRFAWVRLSGDFDVVSKTRYPVDGLYKGGLMARQNLEEDGPYVWLRGGGNAGRNFGMWKMTPSGNFNGHGDQPGPWGRLVRKGDRFIAYGSTDGENWQKIKELTMDLNDILYVGLAVTGRGSVSTVSFSGLNGFDTNFLANYKTKNIGYSHPDTATFRGRVAERTLDQDVVHLTGSGRIDLPDARDIAFSPEGLLAVADDGRDQNVKFFDVSGESPELAYTLGKTGGIFSGTLGTYGDYKLSGPNALGFDADGNTYVSTGSSSARPFDESAHWQTDIRAYSGPEKRDGELLWKMLGLGFVDSAAFDPQQPEHLYTEVTHVELDYEPSPNDANYEPGMEWDETYDVTQDWFSYDDTRVSGRTHFKQEVVVASRNIGGHKYKFLTGMSPTSLGIYRQVPGTTIFQPVGLIFASDSRKAVEHWPEQAPVSNPWIWRDANNDGQLQGNEFVTADNLANVHSWHIDHDGNIWMPAGGTLQVIPLAEQDNNGILTYEPEEIRSVSLDEFKKIKQVSYDRKRDELYVGGLKPDTGRGAWKSLGDRIVCYENGSSSNREVKWKTELSWDKDDKPTGLARAGELLFFGRGRSAHIQVMNRNTGERVGRMTPGATGGSGWLDVAQPIDAVRRNNGEYLVAVEEDWLGRILLYRLSY